MLNRITFALGAVLVLTARSIAAQSAPFEVLAEKETMVPMRDGVKLATDIYRPARGGKAADGRFPVIFSRTPYGKKATGEFDPKHYVPHGYIVVRQDTRGRGGSEGVWKWMSDDRQDGYDAVEWIAQQPWSNGKIGMMGGSYVGATQHLAAMARPPHLTTISPADPSINHGRGATIYGGAFQLRVWDWIFDNSATGSRQSRDPALKAVLDQHSKDRRHYLLNLPLRRGLTPLRLASEYEDLLIDMMEHRRNDDYWKFSNVIDYVSEHKDLPIFMVSGWYDVFSGGTTETFAALKRQLKSPVHLIMGPWMHVMQARSHGEVDFGPDAAVTLTTMRRAWFDRWLKEDVNALTAKSPFRTPVRLFVMGTGDGHKTERGLLHHGGYWRDEVDYPLPQAKPTRYYLQPGGGLSPEVAHRGAASTSFDFDPKNPVPTVGGAICCARDIMSDGARNQWGGEHTWNWPHPIPLSARNDVVVFQTPPLEQDTEIIGPIEVRLWASSSAVDTDFTAKLIDVYPSSTDFPAGFDLIQGDGIIRARYRDSDKEEKFMKPGEVYEFRIKVNPACNVFKKGHRIRVDISSSNFPRFDVNSNTGEPANNHRRMITAVNTIYHDAAHPSHIVLPLVPIERAANGRP